MSDSLDLLLTRQPPNSSRRPAATSQYAQQSGTYGGYAGSNNGYTSSRNSEYAPRQPASVAPQSGGRPTSYGAANQPAAYGGSSYDRTDANPSPTNANSSFGSSLSSGLTSKPPSSSDSGPVNWAALKAKRIGSASANAPSAAAAAAPVTGRTQIGAQSAAADAYVKSPSVAASLPSTSTSTSGDDTVINGAAIFGVRASPPPSLKPAELTPIKRNPLSSPTGSPASSPFATATSTFTRPAPLGSPAGSPKAADGGGATGVRQVQTFSCPDCRRNFKRGSLLKHQKICKKVFQTKRGPFDSTKARTQDLGLEAILYQDATEEEERDNDDANDDDAARPRTGMPKPREETKEQQQDGAKDKSWKDQSESLREAMRRAKKNKSFASSNMMGIDLRAMMPKGN